MEGVMKKITTSDETNYEIIQFIEVVYVIFVYVFECD